ncbi:MAG: hypothetical protein ACOYMX_04735, partial [Burkholderiales bacterium]
TVLMSGHHEAIRRWRLKQSLARTLARRPDLLQQKRRNEEEARLLQDVEQEQASVEKNDTGSAGRENK